MATLNVYGPGTARFVKHLLDPKAKLHRPRLKGPTLLERAAAKPTVPRKNGSRIGSEERRGELMYYLDCASCGIKTYGATVPRRCPSCHNVP
jgi:rubrerythrin